MAWSKTYTHTLACAVDILLASWFWNSYDVTISARCGMAMKGLGGSPTMIKLGKILNKIQTNHCELAIQADIARAEEALKYLKQKSE